MGQSLMVVNIVLTAANIVIMIINLFWAVERRRQIRSREARAEYFAEQSGTDR
jgi:hypothetical protein